MNLFYLITNSSMFILLEDWLMVQYFNGDNYTPGHHCNGKPRQGILSIRCEEDGKVSNLVLQSFSVRKTGPKLLLLLLLS